MSSTPLDKARHIKYWQRCQNNFLPSAYTGNDSTRLTFAFFIVSALDLLSVPLTDQQRHAVRTWVLSLQHPHGGFCGSPTHSIAGAQAGKGSANIAATFFALVLLGLVAGPEGDEQGGGGGGGAFAGVERKKLLEWMKKLQREDGSFGQVLWEEETTGGRDMRHSYLAASIRWMLRGDVKEGDEDWVEDVDVEKMLEHIRGVHTYDGGVSESSQQEAHAGYAYCAIAALSLLDRPSSSTATSSNGYAMQQGIPDRQALLKFLAHRQFIYLSKEEEEHDDEEDENFLESQLGELSLIDGCKHIGWNGRWNKKADTCYIWWVVGTLHLLDSTFLFDEQPTRNYLLDITQHRIGGFSKAVGGPPDIYHSYLGLTALAMMGDSDLKELDVGLCCSKEATQKIAAARGRLLGGSREEGKQGDQLARDGFWEKAKQMSLSS